MPELRRRLLSAGGGGEYIPLEYIESTGTQYINTGVKGNNTRQSLYLDAQLTAVESGWHGLFGTTGASPYPRWYLDYSYSPLKWQFGWGSATSDYIAYGTPDTDRHIFEMQLIGSTFTASIDSTSVVNRSKGGTSPNLDCYLFAANDHSPGSATVLYCKMRLYSCKVYAGSSSLDLVRDFIPCQRRSDGAIGLYDLCESASPFDGTPFYGNSGTGSFVFG